MKNIALYAAIIRTRTHRQTAHAPYTYTRILGRAAWAVDPDVTATCHVLDWTGKSPRVRARQRKRAERIATISSIVPRSLLHYVRILSPNNLSWVQNILKQFSQQLHHRFHHQFHHQLHHHYLIARPTADFLIGTRDVIINYNGIWLTILYIQSFCH